MANAFLECASEDPVGLLANPGTGEITSHYLLKLSEGIKIGTIARNEILSADGGESCTVRT
jgi:hypothetical protein